MKARDKGNFAVQIVFKYGWKQGSSGSICSENSLERKLCCGCIEPIIHTKRTRVSNNNRRFCCWITPNYVKLICFLDFRVMAFRRCNIRAA